jgi:hypothetical protein
VPDGSTSIDPVEGTSLPPPIPTAEPSLPETTPGIRIDWEQFMGAKLFAWLGGLAGFLAFCSALVSLSAD